MTHNNQIHDIRLKAKLNDSQQQKGVSWRKTKLEAVAEARKKGYTEKAIFIELKKAGLVNHTVNNIMQDAWYCNEIEPIEESHSPKKQAEQIAKMLKEQEKQKK